MMLQQSPLSRISRRSHLDTQCRASGSGERDRRPPGPMGQRDRVERRGAQSRGPRPERPMQPHGGDRQHARQGPPRPEHAARPLPSSNQITARLLAVQQLLRIDEEGAFAGLVGGSPKPRDLTQEDEDELALEEEAGGSDQDPAAGAERLGSGAMASTSGRAPSVALDPRQQRALKTMVAGVTRWRRRLDYTLSSLTQRTPAELEAPVRQILRLALYELQYMELAPHAISEFVDLARRLAASGEGAASFTNGVLRAMVRRMASGDVPSPEAELGPQPSARDYARYLAIAHSHPTWLASRWLARFGEAGAVSLMTHNNRPPVYTVRVNTLRVPGGAEELAERLREVGVDAVPCDLMPHSFVEVRQGLQTLLAEGFVARGECVVQDVSAGLVVAMLDPRPGERILDCCAAPGGKATFAAARMQGKGSITALDISAPRLKAVKNLAVSQGVPNAMIRTVAADLRAYAAAVSSAPQPRHPALTTATKIQAAWGDAPATPTAAAPATRAGGAAPAAASVPAPPASLFDRVLLDAPCSGSGVMAKRADMRWRRTHADMAQLVGLQVELLDAAAALVRPGGVLVYSTCSIESDEGEEQVAAFLRRPAGAGFKLVPADKAGVMGQANGVPAEAVTASGCMATLPHVHGVDGAFAARLVRVK